MLDLLTLVIPAVTQPAKTTYRGSTTLTQLSPAKFKIQTTGPGASTLLDQGPSAGKQWQVSLQLVIEETDV